MATILEDLDGLSQILENGIDIPDGDHILHLERLRQIQIKKHETLVHEAEAREVAAAQEAARAVALCEGRAAVTRRHAVEIKAKLHERDSRIGNLEDTIAALKGKTESEITRCDKLSASNASLKELLEKQVSLLLTTEGEEEADTKAALIAANTRCCALESKINALVIDHRAANRRLSRELSAEVRGLNTQRRGIEAEMNALHRRNRGLIQALRVLADAATHHGIALPAVAAAELGGYRDDAVDETSEDAASRSVEATSHSRGHRSPSKPFRPFVGKRAASPRRSLPEKGSVGASIDLSCNEKPVETPDAQDHCPDYLCNEGSSSNYEGASPKRAPIRKQSPSEFAQKKHAARLRAVRGSSSKWGFSV